MEFNLNMGLDNAALQTSDDLANALEKIAKRIREQGYVEHVLQEGDVDTFTRAIADTNGNPVGYWSLELDESDLTD